MPKVALSYDVIRDTCARIYIDWLNKNDLLSVFSSHNSLESAFYTKKLTDDAIPIIEFIFEFLIDYQVFEISGGMYVLKRPVESLLKVWENRVMIDKMDPVYIFMRKGLNYLEDIMNGGTGSWGAITQHILFELLETKIELHLTHPDAIELNLIKSKFRNPRVGIFGIFPQVALNYVETFLPNHSSIQLIVPDERIKKQIISYCELDESLYKYSTKVVVANKGFEKITDFLIIPNGFYLNSSLSNRISELSHLLTSGSMIFFQDMRDPSKLCGFEPLFMFHPDYSALKEFADLDKKLKSNGFTKSKRFNSSSRFVYATKQG